MKVKNYIENLIFSRPAVYRAKHFLVETVIWQWILCRLFRLKQKPLPKYLEAASQRRVLLVGCGPGDVSTGPSIENSADTFAMDISIPFAEAFLATHRDSHVYCGDLLNLPHRDKEFDVTVAFSLLHHIPVDAAAVVTELARVSKSKLVILEGLVPPRGLLRQALLLWYKIVDGGHHYYSSQELNDKFFSDLGLKIEKMEFYSPIEHMMLVVLDCSQAR